MNPSAHQMAFLSDLHTRERAVREAHRNRLHEAAVARRRKAKRGGKR